MARGMYGAIKALEQAASAQQRLTNQQNRETEKARKQQYLENRLEEVAQANANLSETVEILSSLHVECTKNFRLPKYEDGKRELKIQLLDARSFDKPLNVPIKADFLPQTLGSVRKRLRSAVLKYEKGLADGNRNYQHAVAEHAKMEQERLRKLEDAKRNYEVKNAALIKEVEDHNRNIDQFMKALESGKTYAIEDFYINVFKFNKLPDGFPSNWKVAYVTESKQLVVEMDLPSISIVSESASYKYIKTHDEIRETKRAQTKVKALYRTTISSAMLRALWLAFRADAHDNVDTVVLNGYVKTIDKATGNPARPCIASVRTTRDVFMNFNLRQVEPEACLKSLNASVSRNPDELASVRPVLEFNMVDHRFVEEENVISTLDTRPNLMDLTPTEFESLITNLFQTMGLETRQTMASRDGGVDCVAFDPRPIFGGKVVIQAKRYKNTVGVAAVRDLYGTLQNEGASKGILVTTSGYGKASFEFAEGKPIELLSGSNLLYLLAEHAGIEAKIIPPDDWMDPSPDS